MEDPVVIKVLEALEPRIQSKNQATDAMIAFLQQQSKKFEESMIRNEQAAIDNRKIFKEEMMDVVEKSIQVNVNGKIDKLNKKSDEMSGQNIQILAKLEEMAPMQETYRINKDFKKRSGDIADWVIKIAGVIVALGIIFGGFVAVVKFQLYKL